MGYVTEVIAPNDREKLSEANGKYARFLQDAKDEPDLEPISQQVREKQKWVVDQLQILSALEEDEARKLAAQQRDREDRARFQKFHELRQQAQLFAAVTGDQLSTDRLEKLRATAHEALAIYAQDPGASVEAWTLADPLPTALKDDEKARLRRRLLRPAPDPHAGGRRGGGPENPRPGNPASPPGHGRLPPPPGRLPRPVGRQLGP